MYSNDKYLSQVLGTIEIRYIIELNSRRMDRDAFYG